MFYANIVHVGANGAIECVQQQTGTRREVEDTVRAFRRSMMGSHPDFPASRFDMLQDSNGKLLFGNGEDRVAVLHNLHQKDGGNFNEVCRVQRNLSGGPRLSQGRNRFKGGVGVRGSHIHGRFQPGSGARGARSPYR